MKKVIKTLVLLFIFLIPTAILFAGCGGKDDGDVMGFVATPKSSALVVNENNEINLEHGYSYTINKDSFTYYAEYASGKKRIKNTSNVFFSTNFPTDGIAPLGNYYIEISYDNYSYNFVINVNKTVAKPVADVSSFIYNGAEQMPEITGVDDTYMMLGEQFIGAEAQDDYFIYYTLKSNCMWDDGTTEPCRISWDILPYEIPTPEYETITFDPYNYSFDIKNHITNAEMFNSIPAFDFQYDLDFGNVDNRAGEHDITCQINNRNYAFAGGAKSVVGKFKINVLYIDIPTFITEFNYTGALQNAQIKGDWIDGVYMVGGTDATNLGTYYTNFALNDSSSMRWTGIEDFEYGEYVSSNIMKVNNYTLKVKWSINPNLVTKPTLIQSEYVFDYDYHAPLSYDSNEGIEFNYNNQGFGYGNDTESNAGEYKVEVRLKYGYVWSDTKTNENLVFDWKITKANLLAPGTGQTGLDTWQEPGGVKAKTTFDISKIFLPFGFDFSTFESEEELESIIGESVTFTDNTFTDSNGIVWIRSTSGDKTTISQSFDLSSKNLGDNQLAYATYYSPDKNFFDKKGIAFNIKIAEKGSQWIYYNSGTGLQSDYTYGDVIVLNNEQVNVRSENGYKLKYSFINTDDSGENFTYYHNSTDTWVDVGEYKVYLELEASADYAFYSKFIHDKITFAKKELTDENMSGVSASKIYRLDELEDSLFVGQVMHNGKVVEGKFQWVNPFYKPSLSESNVTKFEFTFTPANTDNYSGYQSKTTLIIERSIVRADIFPVLGRVPEGYGYNFFFEGDKWSDIILDQSNAYARDKENYIVKGTWSLVIPEDKTIVDDNFALKFSPENQTYYQDCIFDNLYGKLDSYFKIKDVCYRGAEPEFIINYGGKLYYHMQYAAVRYENHTMEFDFEYDINNFTINHVDGGYTLTYLDHTSSTTYNYSKTIEVKTEYDLINYVLYHDGVTLDDSTVLIVNGNIVVNDVILGSNGYCLDKFRMFIPEGSSVSFESTVYLDEDVSTQGEDIFATDAVIHNLAHTFYNFGTLKFNDVYGNMELRNYNETTIDRYCLDYLSMYNANGGVVNVNLCEHIEYRAEYRSFGSFENHGTFNYLYHIEQDESSLKDSVNEDELYRFRIEKKSINTGTLNGLFEIATADFFLNSGTQISPFLEVYYKNSNGNVTYKEIRTISRDESIAESKMGKFEIRAETVADLVLAFKLNYELERSEHVIIRVMNDIDISAKDDWFYNFNVTGSKHMATLLVRENCQLIISSNATLTLGEFKLGLQYNNYQENKGKLINYGKIVGDVVCEANKFSTHTETYYQHDYVSGDGVFEGTIWKKDDYFAAQQS